jgi:flagellar biosynthesis/type III secretory pathway chaperone
MNMDERSRMEALLDSELALAEQLCETLECERNALTGTSPEAVRQQAAMKIDLLARLEEAERARRDLCRDQDIAAMADSVTTRWRSLISLMSRCRTANEVNGYIINVRRNQVQQLFDVVRGAQAITYGPAGKAFPKALRELARA